MHSSQCQIQLENHFQFNSNGCNVKLSTTTIHSKLSEIAQGSVSQGLIYNRYGERNIWTWVGRRRKRWWLRLLKLLATINPWNFSCLRKQQPGWPSLKASRLWNTNYCFATFSTLSLMSGHLSSLIYRSGLWLASTPVLILHTQSVQCRLSLYVPAQYIALIYAAADSRE